MRFALVAFLASMFLAACGGGGGGGASQSPTPTMPTTTPATAQSAGGIWHIFTTVPAGSLTFFIGEDGTLRVMDGAGPSFGAGAVVVNGVDDVAGSYHVRAIQPNPAVPAAADRDCTFDGKVVQRASMQVVVRCTDTAGAKTEQSATFFFDAAYGQPSSLEAIAGNYTLSFAPQSNSLTIAKDGTIFGVYHNGQQCTVNGRVDLIDARFNLYRFAFSFSSCQVFQQFEGQTLTGLAARSMPGAVANSLLLLITGVINGRLEFVSVSYEPV